jgi:hypothetical protein
MIREGISVVILPATNDTTPWGLPSARPAYYRLRLYNE